MYRGTNLSRFLAGALVALLTLTSACDKDSLQPPTATNVSPSVQRMFTRYVAMGNSITAGLQSGGINDSTQLEAYPVLLARQMGLQVANAATSWTNSWNTPLMRGPGCPPPYVNIFSQVRLGGGAESDCDYRRVPIPTFVNNVAFPGADVVETFNYYDPGIVPSATDVYKTFLLGGRTQIEAARAMDPTFLTIWIGNNDILGALLDETDPGNANLYPTPAEFAETYGQMMDSVDTFANVDGGVLIGVVQVSAAPYASVGGAYYQASLAIPTLTVDLNCLAKAEIPGTTDSASVLIPFHYGAPIMGAAALGVPQTIDCSVDAVVSPMEAIGMIVAVAQYNAAIAAEAAERDWIFVDPNALLAGLAQDPAAIRPFPAYDAADPQHVTAPFGWALSLDGLHPSGQAHILIADALIDAINTKYGASIPNIVQQ